MAAVRWTGFLGSSLGKLFGAPASAWAGWRGTEGRYTSLPFPCGGRPACGGGRPTNHGGEPRTSGATFRLTGAADERVVGREQRRSSVGDCGFKTVCCSGDDHGTFLEVELWVPSARGLGSA